MSDYLSRCAAESLRRAGASESEVSDFADILLLQCHDARKLTPLDALCYLESWREERRMIATAMRNEVIDYVEQKTVIRIPVLVTLEPGTRMDSSRGTTMYAAAGGNVWCGCEMASRSGLIRLHRLVPSQEPA